MHLLTRSARRRCGRRRWIGRCERACWHKSGTALHPATVTTPGAGRGAGARGLAQAAALGAGRGAGAQVRTPGAAFLSWPLLRRGPGSGRGRRRTRWPVPARLAPPVVVCSVWADKSVFSSRRAAARRCCWAATKQVASQYPPIPSSPRRPAPMALGGPPMSPTDVVISDRISPAAYADPGDQIGVRFAVDPPLCPGLDGKMTP